VRLYLSETSEPAQARTPRHRPVSGYVGARRNLLVVDDHPTQRQMLAGMLLPLGFRIREAASGRECLDSVLEQAPDAVLLDISMDDMNGWETARRIRAAGLTALPIIMVSANAFENQPALLAEAGCQGFVDKPVIESELLVVLQRELELEWVAELAVPAWAQPPALAAPGAAARAPLPPEHARRLLQLARLGHPQGLKDALDALARQHPACEAEAEELRVLVARFAWHDLKARLAATLAASEASEPSETSDSPAKEAL